MADEAADTDDQQILRSIEIQQQREIAEMKERHRQQNLRMRSMIKERRLKERQEASKLALGEPMIG